MIFYFPRKRLCGRLCALLFNVVALFACAHAAFAAQTTGALAGRITDQFGAVVVGASVVVKDAAGTQERQAVSDSEGRYVFNELAPGTYSVRVEAQGFATFESEDVRVERGARKQLDARLTVGLERQDVTVGAEGRLGVEAEANRSALNLRDAELDALPEDAEDLAAALQALAGVPVGPNGGQILIDGFLNTGEPLPQRSSIREVRINQNPFSAENDQVGFGQIQIITRPGTDEWHGQGYFLFTDESFNSRNPFADRRAPYQMRHFGGTLGGPLASRRASFFASLDRRETDDNAIVNAFVLDDELNVTRFVRTVLVPRRPINASVRFDFQLSKNHTLTARYNFFRSRVENAGVGGTFLPERGFDFTLPIHTLQLTETAVLGARVVNEFRLQYIAEDQVDKPLSEEAGVNVLGAFAAGGSSAGRASNPERRLTVQDSVLWTSGAQTLRAGARLRRTTITDVSPDDFNGTFTFAGGLAPQLDTAGDPVQGAGGQIVNVPITSIERYRRTLLFQRRSLAPAEIRARGGGATQLTVGGGNPRATAEQVDVGAYFQDDWRVRPNLMLSFGLRYEFQTNIGARPNFAPRVAFAWAPDFKGGAGSPSQPLTVVRGGFGVFFDRFNENQVLIANKYAAGDFFRFITADTAALDSFPNVPPAEALRVAGAAEQTVFRLAEDLREPYMMQAALGVERQLPFKSTLAVTYVAARTLHALRARNTNAPIITRGASGEIVSRMRPNALAGNVIQYESSGRLKQHQLNLTFNNRLSRRVSFFINYTLSSARGDTESAGTLPADSYDLRGEYGRSSTDARHTFSAGGTFDVPLGLRLSPLVYASSGRPFNITTGEDANGDSIFADRPALASDLTRPSVRLTPFGAFDTDPLPGQSVIPRNYGEGPNYFVFNINVSRTFVFGKAAPKAGGQGVSQAGAGGDGRYRFTLGARIINIFNRVNFDLPVGNLGSPFFGQSVAVTGGFGAARQGHPAAGNRRVETQVRFEF